MTGKRAKRWKWKKCDWGLDLGGVGEWSVQVYEDAPPVWRVFDPTGMVAEGDATTVDLAKKRARAVYEALIGVSE
jgi:hypothetical protein